MALSLRLPLPIEAQIAGLSARAGISKSALIVRSIEEYLNRHAQPSAFELYEEVMRESARKTSAISANAASADARPHKQAVRAAVRAKQAQRVAVAAAAAAAESAATKRVLKKTA